MELFLKIFIMLFISLINITLKFYLKFALSYHYLQKHINLTNISLNNKRTVLIINTY